MPSAIFVLFDTSLVILLATKVLFGRQFLRTWTNCRYLRCPCLFLPPIQKKPNPRSALLQSLHWGTVHPHPLTHTHANSATQVELSAFRWPLSCPGSPLFPQLFLVLFSTLLRLLTSSSPLPFSADHLASEFIKNREAT